MLYLSRKVGESIIINNSIELIVTEIRGKSVKMGFKFPSDASILRKELFDKISEQNKASREGDAEMASLFEEGLSSTNSDKSEE